MRWTERVWAALAAGLLAGMQTTAQQPPPAPAAPQTRFVVVLDAAHGGGDSGARLADGQLEKNVTLALSVRLRSLLAARGFSVVTTRESDAAVAQDKRAEIANHVRAQACLVLHATQSGSGVHLFSSSLAPALRTGDSNLPMGASAASPVRIPAWKTAQAGWGTRSLALMGVLNSSLLQAGMNVTLARIELPGLQSLTCPAVTVELAPELGANKKIAAGPDDEDYQARVAAALAAALVEDRAEAHPL